MTTPQARRERAADDIASKVLTDLEVRGIHTNPPGRWLEVKAEIIAALLTFAAQEAEQASAQAHTLAKHDIAEVVAQARIAEKASIEQARAEERERCAQQAQDMWHGLIAPADAARVAEALRAAPPPGGETG